jgi:hypothetical protein
MKCRFDNTYMPDRYLSTKHSLKQTEISLSFLIAWKFTVLKGCSGEAPVKIDHRMYE